MITRFITRSVRGSRYRHREGGVVSVGEQVTVQMLNGLAKLGKLVLP
jgi:hypothetical protein